MGHSILMVGRKKSDGFMTKRQEFLATYQGWATDKLEEVVQGKDRYSDYARSAAIEVLEQRKQIEE